jgi:hypothetical protein
MKTIGFFKVLKLTRTHGSSNSDYFSKNGKPGDSLLLKCFKSLDPAVLYEFK